MQEIAEIDVSKHASQILKSLITITFSKITHER